MERGGILIRLIFNSIGWLAWLAYVLNTSPTLPKGTRPMTYDEAIEATVTKAEAFAEIRKHGIDPNEFLEEMGDRETYAGGDVLSWLGY
jgi:hypothetical protein